MPGVIQMNPLKTALIHILGGYTKEEVDTRVSKARSETWNKIMQSPEYIAVRTMKPIRWIGSFICTQYELEQNSKEALRYAKESLALQLCRNIIKKNADFSTEKVANGLKIGCSVWVCHEPINKKDVKTYETQNI